MELVGAVLEVAAVVLVSDVVDAVVAVVLVFDVVDVAVVDFDVLVDGALLTVLVGVVTGGLVVFDGDVVAGVLTLTATGASPSVVVSLEHADITIAAVASPATPASHFLIPIATPDLSKNYEHCVPGYGTR